MPIQILPARLANQIAAGEVVERPASVVKELVENSLDAGATRIDIDIEKGGSRLIRIRDNGKGIPKDELALALSRHATSKITTLDDLEAIVSLGFRGEALASISSVSRLTLTSRTQAQEEAWSAYAEGRDMDVQLKPAAHPVGTTLEVLDLFFNTPARRKFLRTEKTEFNHIDELIKRIALSRFDVAITLRHNGKIIRQYRTAQTPIQKERRLATACGSGFLQHALVVELAHGDLKLSGWVCSSQGARAQNDIQYCYVNGRMMKDKLINHAIRQAYESSLRSDQYAAYVLYIDVDPHQVDVNVHPAKHEVRFHQARLVHDFIYQALQSALQQGALEEEQHHYQSPTRASAHSIEVDEDGVVIEPEAQVTQRVVQAIDAVPEYPHKSPSSEWNKSASTPSYSASSPIESDMRGSAVSAEYAVSEASEHNISSSYSASSNTHREPYQYDRSPSERQRSDQTINTTRTSDTSSGASRSPKPEGPTAAEIKAYQKLLQTEVPAKVEQSIEHVAEPRREWQSISSTAVVKQHAVAGKATGLGKALCLVSERYLLMQQETDIVLLALDHAELLRYVGQLRLAQTEGLKPQPLLIPLSVPVESELIACAEQHAMLLKQLGIQLKAKGRNGIIIMSVCMPLRQQNLQQLIPNLLTYLLTASDDSEAQGWDKLLYWLAEQCVGIVASYSLSQAIQLVSELEQLWGDKLADHESQLFRPVDMQSAIEAFK
ncbi:MULTISPECIES: DNA mismatch repair endonuclease MutL [unclassified Photobacterium]|uniref:DNA mismatch repair endonuclease MutL n=1 Tax=unclassified Photobacterium TaxID=2628852 RepID=UPI001EDDFB09|nr:MULTISPECIES: DNA mismatch repair endonuclease MutL [unclassified Photobacterium]MCG3865926.1 DNA mismatch repair endonuclease MutL [Photobacterium sp. Ph6]MCG3877382.1 DNA mismatch repair endonuclease MutL [Photobacterium sp. Ph5]